MAGKPDPQTIKQAKTDNPKLRARDLAARLGISEAEYVAAWCGDGTARLDIDFDRFFDGLKNAGEVMALTRNESAVHEKTGVYDNFISGKVAAMMLGEDIDTRMFREHFVHAFAVEAHDGDKVSRSVQFFDAHGDAVHKIHARGATNVDAWDNLVSGLMSDDQTPDIEVTERAASANGGGDVDAATLREHWSKLTDTHQFFPMLRKLEIDRLDAVRGVGDDYAWRLDNSSVASMMRLSAKEELPIMCFVGNPGCIQIHSGPISKIVEMGPWINIMDPGFHLHLRLDHITEAWAVRKPTGKGHVTSLEAYDANGELVIQFFGKRIEGQDEREGWRVIMENLPRLTPAEAA